MQIPKISISVFALLGTLLRTLSWTPTTRNSLRPLNSFAKDLTEIVTSKQVRLRLGTYFLDIKYKPEDIILVSKPGADDYVCVLANPQMLRDEGVDIPAFQKSEPKTESKKMK